MAGFVQSMWNGPGHFRFYLQPLLALALGLRDGVADARAGRPPYGLFIAAGQGPPLHRLAQVAKQLAVPLVVAIAMDWVFQLIIRGRVHPLVSVVYAAVFVAFPYVLSRGVTNRTARRLVHGPTHASA
jgi:hypothetical protein